MNIFFSTACVLLISVFYSCKKDNPVGNEGVIFKKNVLIVLEANNSLKREAIRAINDIEYGYSKEQEGVIYVLLKSQPNESVLIKIRSDKDLDASNSDTVRVIKNVLSNADLIGEVAFLVQKLAPAQSYGIILWSHGTSWYPGTEWTPNTKAFGDDNGKNIDISALARAIPKNYEYIFFDACNMASLEVIYQFKDNCRFFVASPSEVISTGFPYRLITDDLVEGNLNVVAIKYFEYYYGFMGLMQSATVSVIKTQELGLLANIFAEILNQTAYDTILERDEVQRMDFTPDFPIATFDFGSYLKHNFNAIDCAALVDQLEKVVILKRNTPYFFGNKITEFSGITCYVPILGQDDINGYYSKLNWAIDSDISSFLSSSN